MSGGFLVFRRSFCNAFGKLSFCHPYSTIASFGPLGMWSTTLPGSATQSFFAEGVMQRRWKKQRRKREFIPPTAEKLATKVRKNICVIRLYTYSRPPIRLEDYIGTPEPPYSIARSIRTEINQILRGRKTKRQFAYRNRHRIRQMVGKAHTGNETFTEQEMIDGSFVTPLTSLQHHAELPRSQLHTRFHFPHTLHYECWWGPPQTEKEPNKSLCSASFKLDELPLSAQQKNFLIEIVGKERYDEETQIVCLESDHFTERNHNAAYLGDILEVLMRETRTM
ncbi:hypothetical protein IE077_004128 [Cardiosporidium cionae]|uniref:Small ribosomal subunit protein mS35 mitochondrial conserved domain-containing protein n=1 Tax=Cardiosporidium cionae TaxID=476202 RepID=A0ABQ7J6Q8_9APIC|nr:hypothetical protein IE077_004128 [Cardiosporidium cionae]|eukprot:KAF8819680.1 hypothetical protein IE077_004128 [Cardiosporidium cionae]